MNDNDDSQDLNFQPPVIPRLGFMKKSDSDTPTFKPPYAADSPANDKNHSNNNLTMNQSYRSRASTVHNPSQISVIQSQASQQSMDDSMTQGSISNRMSIKGGGVRLEAFSLDKPVGGDHLGGLKTRNLRLQQSAEAKIPGITTVNLDDDDDQNNEDFFEEVNLSLCDVRKSEIVHTDHSKSPQIPYSQKPGGSLVTPANKKTFARGLENLPRNPEKLTGDRSPEAQPPADSFNNALQYWLTCIGYAVGYGNIWRFPYLLYTNGGGAFLVPYFLSVFFLAIPMYAVETAFGQCYKQQLSRRLSSVSPVLWGFSFAQLFVCTVSNLYYVVLMAWSIAYLFESFITPLPWVKRSFIGRPDDFHSSTHDATTAKHKATSFFNKDFFAKTMLQETDSIAEGGGLVPLIVLSLAVAYVLIYFTIWKGVESSGKVVYFTALFPYLLLFVMLIRGLTLEGASEGLYYLYNPDFSKLGNVKVWRDGVNQVIFSSGIAFGPLVFYSSCRQPDEKILRSSFWLPLINSATSILAATVLFSFLGHVSSTLGIPIEEMEIEGIELAFVAYPAMLSMLPGSNIWAVIFFLMLIVIGIDSIFATFDFVMSFLLSEYPIIGRKCRKEIFSLILVICSFLFGLIFCLEQGIHIFELFDHYAVGLSLLFMELANTLILGWYFDMIKLDELMFKATGERFPKPLFFIVRYGLVVVMTLSFTSALIHEFSNPLDLPTWALFFGWMLMLTPLLLALGGMFVPKSRVLCCLEKYSNKGVANIEYAENNEASGEVEVKNGRDQIDIAGDKVRDGEIELQTNIKLTRMIGSDTKPSSHN